MNKLNARALIESAKIRFASEIKEADANPDKWYELYLTGEDGGTQSISSADTFAKIGEHFIRYVERHGLDGVNIDLWAGREQPCPMCVSFIPKDPQVIYGKGYLHTFEIVVTDTKPFYVFEEVCDDMYENIFNGISEWLTEGFFKGEYYVREGERYEYSCSWRIVHTDETAVHDTGTWPVTLFIKEDECETIEVSLDPAEHPRAFDNKVRCLMKSGLSREAAERDATTPVVLELFYSIDQGLFAVESGAVDCSPVYNPYDGREIPKLE